MLQEHQTFQPTENYREEKPDRGRPENAFVKVAIVLFLLGIVAVAISAYMGQKGYVLDAATYPMQ